MPSPESGQIHRHKLIEANCLTKSLGRAAMEGTGVVGVNVRSNRENHDASHNKLNNNDC